MARHQQFGGFGGGANMQQLMRQAQKLQQQMTKAQEDIEAPRNLPRQAGGGMVSVTVNGKHEVTGIQIKPAVRGSRGRGNAAGHGDGRGERGPAHR